MKSLTWLTEKVLRDCGTRCGADPSRDVITVTRRVEHEGESFLTITLPNLGSAFDRALATGGLQRTSCSSFRWHKKGLPEFLRGFLLQVFNTDGLLLPDPSHEAILCIRQICYLHKKVLRECSDARSKAAIAKFKECENGLEGPSADPAILKRFGVVCRILWANLLHNVPFGDLYEELRPKHGPGGTVEGVRGNAKYNINRWYSRLEREFPYTEFAVSSLRNLGWDSSPLETVEFVEPGREAPVKVTLVPKTLKTPRVIAIEPVCMQYMQQALLQSIVPRVEKGRYTKGRVNFSDQSINRTLAQSSSQDGRFATIDLSEASDRVSLSLVELMLETVPRLRDQIMACRSTHAVLPCGEVIPLKKFASMGSALCFPMEALAFFAIGVLSRIDGAKEAVSSRSVRKYARDVYVYGDDILVPTHEAPVVCTYLESFGLKVNTDKSFWTGKFRESCGMDAYDGTDVTPTYVRSEPPAHKLDAEEVVSWVSMANQFYLKGFWGTARAIREFVEKKIGKLPTLRVNSHGLYWVNFSNSSEYRRWNKDLMRFENRVLVPVPVKRTDRIADDSALMKCLAIVGLEAMDHEHLQQTVIRGRFALKTRWVGA